MEATAEEVLTEITQGGAITLTIIAIVVHIPDHIVDHVVQDRTIPVRMMDHVAHEVIIAITAITAITVITVITVTTVTLLDIAMPAVRAVGPKRTSVQTNKVISL